MGVYTSCSSISNISSDKQHFRNIDPCKCDDGPNEITCHTRYKPVCGCDSITYDNACLARKKGIKSWIKGACK